MLVPIYDVTWHHVQENSNLYGHCPENLESQIHFAYSTTFITQVTGCGVSIKLQALLHCTGTLSKIDGNLKIQYKIKLAEWFKTLQTWFYLNLPNFSHWRISTKWALLGPSPI